jgi:ribosomal protein L11 methyltransferase
VTEPRYPTVLVAASPDEAELLGARLWAAGATGIEERDAETLLGPELGATLLLVAYFDDPTDADAAAAELAADGVDARRRDVVGDGWREGWRAFFRPVRIGRLLLRPSWEEPVEREGDARIVLDPGQAFGTGMHETTRLVLATLVDHIRGGERVLDVGCGSGVLAIAALVLGAASARATDIDPTAVRTTLENAERNGVPVDADTVDPSAIEGTFDVVVANIRTPVLVPMAEALKARARGGLLVLSGVLAEEEGAIRQAFGVHGALRREGDWVALVYRP